MKNWIVTKLAKFLNKLECHIAEEELEEIERLHDKLTSAYDRIADQAEHLHQLKFLENCCQKALVNCQKGHTVILKEVGRLSKNRGGKSETKRRSKTGTRQSNR